MGPDTATGRMNAQAWERQQPPAAGGGRRIPPWSMGRGHSPQTPWSWTLASARGENAFLSFQAAPLGLLIYGSCRARRDEPRAEGRARPPDPAGSCGAADTFRGALTWGKKAAWAGSSRGPRTGSRPDGRRVGLIAGTMRTRFPPRGGRQDHLP